MNKTNKQAKQNQRHGNKEQTDRHQRGGEERDKGGKKRKGLVINDPWAWTTGWGLTVGGGRRGMGEQWGKIETTVIEQQLKKTLQIMCYKPGIQKYVLNE